METTNHNLPVLILAEPCKNSTTGIYEDLRRPLNKQVKWVREICSLQALFTSLQEHTHAIVLLHVFLPGFKGEHSLIALKAANPNASFILTSLKYSAYYSRMVKSGFANAYLLKTSTPPPEYVKAIEACKQNTSYTPPDVSLYMLQSENDPLQLEDNEWPVFDLVLKNIPIKEMISLTSIHEGPLRRLVNRIKEVTYKHNPYGPLGYAIQYKIVTPEMVEIIGQ